MSISPQFYDNTFPGKIKIQDILACGFLDDLLEVSCSNPYHNNIIILVELSDVYYCVS